MNSGGFGDQEPYPDDPSSEGAPAPEQLLKCQVCGGSFTLVEPDTDAATLPDARAFLDRHRRCLRQVLQTGGALAHPAAPRRGRGTTLPPI